MKKKSAHSYDVREIRMIKYGVDLDLDQLINDGSIQSSWVCFGHFDFIQLRSISNNGIAVKDPLACFEKAANTMLDEQWNKPVSNSFRSLYMIKDVTGQKMNGFWDNQSLYILVARIHCDDPHEREAENVSQGESVYIGKLLDRCQKRFCFKKASGEGWFELVPKDMGGIFGCFYESLELGDIVGLFRSNQLTPLLQLARDLHEDEYVSDIYSYLGVNYKTVYDNFDVLMQNKTKVEELKKQKIPYITTRFSIRQASEAKLLFEQYADKVPQYYVTGTADAVVRWSWPNVESVNEYMLLKKLHDLLELLHKNAISYHKAFYDVITRVGIEYRAPINSRRADLSLIRLDQFDKNVRWKWLYEDEGKKIPNQWSPALRRLLASLRTMSANSVMDDLAAMLIPSVQVLLNRVLQHAKQPKHRWDKCSNDVQYFLEGWARLADDLLQLESQLTQHPELAPLPRAIPAMLLQFQQHFVRCAARLLDDTIRDNSDSRFAPILFPCTTDYIATRPVLDPENENGVSYLLCIEIPVDQLYNPYKNAYILIHEVAHYVGETTRNREKRLITLCRCMAIAATNIWRMRIELQYGIEKENTFLLPDDYFEELADGIRKNYELYLPLNALPYYLNVIDQQIISATIRAACEHSEFERFKAFLFAGGTAREQLNILTREYWEEDYDWFTFYKVALEPHWSMLMSLVRECYADLAMIELLGCDFDNYYESVYKTELKRLNDLDYSPEDWQMRIHRYRLQLVSGVMGSEWTRNAELKGDDLKTCEVEEPSDMKGSITPDGENNSEDNKYDLLYRLEQLGNTLDKVELNELEEYLRECKENLSSFLKGRSLQKELKIVSPSSFDWGKMRRFSELEALKWRAEKVSKS